MREKVIKRGLYGIPIGITIGYIITIIISLAIGSGKYFSCVPEIIEIFESEIVAVIIQTLLCGLIGGIYSASSVIWEMESWSIVKQTGIYFGIISITMLPIAYFTHWMEHSVRGFLIYFGIFLVIFFIIWVIQYKIWKNKVKKIDNKVRN